MTQEDIHLLEEKYRQYASAHGEATERGDYKQANKNYHKLYEVLLQLQACGEEGESALRRLMNDSYDPVVCWAATHSLSFAEADAIRVLKELSQKKGIIAFGAEMVLQQWEKGEL